MFRPLVDMEWCRGVPEFDVWFRVRILYLDKIPVCGPNHGKAASRPEVESVMPAKTRHRLDLNDEDSSHLSVASETFALPKSEVVRRLVRAAIEVGPALSNGNAVAIVELSGQIRAVGRNLAQVVRAINTGHAVRIAAFEPIFRGLHDRISALDGELTEMTVAYGSRLRRHAKLEIKAATG